MNSNQPRKTPLEWDAREAMLPGLLDYMDRIHAGRRTRRRVFVAASATAMLLLVVTMIIPRQPSAAPPTIAQPTVERMPAPATANFQTWLVTTRPGIAERYAIETYRTATRIEQVGNAPKFVEYLTDDRLLRVLADFGRPTGLIRMREKALLTAVVTDAELAADGTAEPSSS